MGYAIPTRSLNDLAICTETELTSAVRLSALKSVYINLPLLLPGHNRIWLSDGSFPNNQFVQPVELSADPPFCNYVPRPFSSVSVASADVMRSAGLCLDTERARIECALAISENNDWDLAVIRINFFDLISHLVGGDYLAAGALTDAVVEACCASLSQLIERLHEATTGNLIVMSPFSHVPCKAAVNLNEIFNGAGLCSLPDSGSAFAASRMQSRLLAYQIVHGGEDKVASPVKLTNMFETDARVCSPVAGAVYVNRADRFNDGTVDPQSVSEIVREATEVIERHFCNAGLEFEMLFPAPSQYERSVLPEFIVIAPGVDFSTYGSGIDFINHSRTTHGSDGFIALPKSAQQARVVDDAVGLLNVVQFLLQ